MRWDRDAVYPQSSLDSGLQHRAIARRIARVEKQQLIYESRGEICPMVAEFRDHP